MEKNSSNSIVPQKLTSSKRTVVQKGWGYEDWIANSEKYCGKKLYVEQGKRCSWHYHKIKDETFFVVSGKVYLRYLEVHEVEERKKLEWSDDLIRMYAWTVTLYPGDSFHIPVGMHHEFYGIEDSVMMEFSTEHKEEDSIRVIKGD